MKLNLKINSRDTREIMNAHDFLDITEGWKIDENEIRNVYHKEYQNGIKIRIIETNSTGDWKTILEINDTIEMEVKRLGTEYYKGKMYLHVNSKDTRLTIEMTGEILCQNCGENEMGDMWKGHPVCRECYEEANRYQEE